MSEEGIPFEDLEVVGYADRLPPDLLPRLVAPIFRRRSIPDQLVLPPFKFQEGNVVGFISSTLADLERAVGQGQATRIEAIDARDGHQLWIDRDYSPNYAPAKQVSARLRDIAKEHVGKAMQSLSAGKYEEASRLAQVAIAANERCFDALLVKAVVQRQLGYEDQVAVLCRIAGVAAPDVNFNALVDLYISKQTAQELLAQQKADQFLIQARERVDLELTLQDLVAALRLLEPFRDLARVTRQIDEIERSSRALEHFRAEISRLQSAKDFVGKIVILIQFCDMGCPGKKYADLPLYRLWSVRSLQTILDRVVDENPDINDDEWAVASTAASYLSRIGTHEAWPGRTSDPKIISTAFTTLEEAVSRCASMALGPHFFWRSLFDSYALLPGANLDQFRNMVSPSTRTLREVLDVAQRDEFHDNPQPVADLRRRGFAA